MSVSPLLSNSSNMPPAVAMDRPTAAPSGPELAQPPNSPVSSQQPKALVDLTETTPTTATSSGKESVDADLEKALKLSLQEQNAQGRFGGSLVNQEDQDVSRALEASLLESQLNGAKRKRGETWTDPLNPHERERNGMVTKTLFF